jgi:hypothetical protein
MKQKITQFELENEILEEKESETLNDPNEFGVTQLRQPRGTGRKDDRYIWFGGNVLTDAQKTSAPEFRLGGESYGTDFPALNISRGVLFRGRITPLTEQPRPMSGEHECLPEVELFGDQLVLPEDDTRRVPIVHARTYPGDQLETIVYGARDGSSMGVVELTALRGKQYSLPETRNLIQSLQLKIFPNWKNLMSGREAMPKTLREIENLIQAAMDKDQNDEIMQSIGVDMLRGCNQFRAWGISYLEREAIRVRAGVNPNGGYVHNYSPVANTLLIQLEQKRESLIQSSPEPQMQLADPNTSALLELVKQQQVLVQQMMAQQNKTVTA